MTDTNGPDILIGWSIFIALLAVLGVLVLRGRTDPVDEAMRNTNGTPAEDQHGQRSRGQAGSDPG